MKFLKQFEDIISMGFICYKLGVFAYVYSIQFRKNLGIEYFVIF